MKIKARGFRGLGVVGYGFRVLGVVGLQGLVRVCGSGFRVRSCCSAEASVVRLERNGGMGFRDYHKGP